MKEKGNKKRKLNQNPASNIVPDISERSKKYLRPKFKVNLVLEEIDLGETDEDLENLELLETLFSKNPNAPLNLDCVIMLFLS